MKREKRTYNFKPVFAEIKTHNAGFTLTFEEYRNDVLHTVNLECDSDYWIQYLDRLLWRHLNNRTHELLKNQSAMKGES